MNPRLTKISFGLFVVLLCAPLFAATETNTYTLQHRSAVEAAEAVAELLGEEGTLAMHPGKRTLIITDDPATHQKIRRFLIQFDAPPKAVRVSISLMLASDKAQDEAGRRTPLSSVSAEVRGVMDSVGDFTRWVDYQPLGSVAATAVEGSSQSVRLDEKYGIEFSIDGVEQTSKGERIRLAPFRLIRYQTDAKGVERSETVFETAMRLEAGRVQVLGAASGADADRALFLTVRAEPGTESKAP